MSNRENLEQFKYRFVKPEPDNLVEVVWGGEMIKKLKGLAPSGRPIGESWECSVHPRHPSKVKLDDGTLVDLGEIIETIGEDILGPCLAREFEGHLPILVKFLDAREDLSVQVHPSDEKAAELGEIDTGKTEAWLILHAEPGAVLYLGFKDEVNRSQFEKDLSSPEVNIAEKYLNAIPARAGEVIINPTGTPHAIGKGVFLVEIQQSSGVTYRVWDWNREPGRELHIPQAMKSFDFRPTTDADFRLNPRVIDGKRTRLIDNFYFSLERINLARGDVLSADMAQAFEILTCIQGKVKLSTGQSEETLSQGESLLVPASLGKYEFAAYEESIILKSYVMTPQQIDPVIFQTYDVRAVADKYLSDRVSYYLGKGYGSFVRRMNEGKTPTVTIGGGVRLSTDRIRRQVAKGVTSTGVNVCDVGTTSTPELYFSIPYLNADGGVNLTASHNEAEYNGLKQVVREGEFITSINAAQMLEIKRTILEADFLYGKGDFKKLDEGEVVRYHNELVKANCRLGRQIWIDLLKKWKDGGLKALLDVTSQLDFPEIPDSSNWGEITSALGLPSNLEQPATAVRHPLAGIKVVIDFGNGSGWRTESVYSDLGAGVVAINSDPDGAFPAHIPDPIKARYRRQLEEAVLKEAEGCEKEVIGIGNDEDADRAIYVRRDGRVVEGDRSLAIQAKAILDEHHRKGRPGRPRFMGEVKFSRIAEEYVRANGGEYIMSPTGFAFIKDGTKALYRALQAGDDEVILFGKRLDLRENREPVVLASELSGHQMSGHEENWIFDDALLAAINVLTVTANGMKEGKTFIAIDEAVPRYPATPELNIRLNTNILAEKEEVVEVTINRFRQKGYAIDTTDGGLIEWLDDSGRWLGQALVRKSNTQPNIICRVEGRDEKARKAIETEFFGELARVSTEAVPQLDLASDDYIREFMGVFP
ncbi:MAG: type I phosphomannose isomerase catalytic subunit [Dehalococcoidia bacterium]